MILNHYFWNNDGYLYLRLKRKFIQSLCICFIPIFSVMILLSPLLLVAKLFWLILGLFSLLLVYQKMLKIITVTIQWTLIFMCHSKRSCQKHVPTLMCLIILIHIILHLETNGLIGTELCPISFCQKLVVTSKWTTSRLWSFTILLPIPCFPFQLLWLGIWKTMCLLKDLIVFHTYYSWLEFSNIGIWTWWRSKRDC